MQAPVAGQPMDPAAGASVMQDLNAMNAAPMDPSMAQTDPNMAVDPNAIPTEDPMANTEQTPEMGAVEDEQGIRDAIAQMGLTGQEADAAEGYIKYLLKNPYNDEVANDVESVPVEDPNATQQPMMETVVFKKSQLEKINEEFACAPLDQPEKEDKETTLKKKPGYKKKSPFSPKKFN